MTQTTYTARQLDDLINERLMERESQWTAFHNDQLQTRSNDLIELRAENEHLKQQMDDLLNRMESLSEERCQNRNRLMNTEDDDGTES